MRTFLTGQMIQKKANNEIEKEVEGEQVKIWNDENQRYFQKENETNERVKQVNKLNADFLKSQFKEKNSCVTKMNEEEYRMNRDILDEVFYTPTATKKNFLI